MTALKVSISADPKNELSMLVNDTPFVILTSVKVSDCNVKIVTLLELLTVIVPEATDDAIPAPYEVKLPDPQSTSKAASHSTEFDATKSSGSRIISSDLPPLECIADDANIKQDLQ